MTSVTLGSNSIESAGNLKINSTSGNALSINGANAYNNLHLYSGTSPTSGMTTISNRGMTITTDVAGRGRLYFEHTGATSGQRIFNMDCGNGALKFHSLNDNATANVALNILALTYDGKVGIGTDNPGLPLEVVGNAYIGTQTNEQVLIGDIHAGGWAGIQNRDAPQAMIAGTAAGRVVIGAGTAEKTFFGSGNGLVFVNSSDYVGIGTSGPSEKLHLYDTGSVKLHIESTGSDANIEIDSQTNGNSYIDFAENTNDFSGRILYAHNGDSMQFSTNGSERLRIDSSGGVGVGTTDPFGNSLFHLANSTDGNFSFHIFERNVGGTDGNYNELFNITSGTFNEMSAYIIYVDVIAADGNNNFSASYTIPVCWNGTSAAWRLCLPTSAGRGDRGSDGQFQLLIRTNNQLTNMRIRRNGTGTAADVTVIMRFSQSDFLGTFTEDTGTGTDATAYAAYGGTGITTLLDRINNGTQGKVGIGTDNPDTELEVYDSTGSCSLTITANDANSSFLLFKDVSGNQTSSIYADHAAEALIFRNNTTTERMRIDSSGNVGIGTNNPAAKLDVVVAGTDFVGRFHNSTASDWSYIAIGNGTTGTSGSGGLLIGYENTNKVRFRNHHASDIGFWDSSAERLTIQNGGNIGIGTNNPTHFVDIRKDDTASLTSMRIFNNPNGSGAGSRILLDTFGVDLYIDAYSQGFTTAGAQIADSALIHTSNASSGLGFLTTSGNFRFYNGSLASPTEIVTFENGGNVGIGTNNPAFLLDVQKGENADIGARIQNTLGGTVARAVLNIVAPGGTTELLTTTGSYTTSGFYVANASYLTSNLTGGLTLACTNTNANADIKFLTNSTERMRIDKDGFIGIGTTNPGFELDIYKNENSATQFRVQNANSGNAAFAQIRTQANGGIFYYRTFSSGYSASGANQADSAQLFADDSLSNGLNIVACNGMSFWTDGTGASNATEQMTILTSGNVGFGTASPSTKLHIYENSTGTNGGLTIENDGSGDAICQFLLTATTRWVMGIDNSDSDKFKIASSADLISDARLVMTTGGSVGIGTTEPGATLHVDSANTEIARFRSSQNTEAMINVRNNSSSISRFDFGYRASGGPTDNVTQAQLFTNSSGTIHLSTRTNNASDIVFYTNAGTAAEERMRITSAGNVGIGTNSSNGPLTLYNPTNAVSQDLLKLRYNNSGTPRDALTIISPSSTDAGDPVEFRTGNAHAFYCDSHLALMMEQTEGHVGIGTTGDTGYRMRVNGEIYIDGADDTTIVNPLSGGSTFTECIQFGNSRFSIGFVSTDFLSIGRVGGGGNDPDITCQWGDGTLTITGGLTKGSGSFVIDHPDPVKKEQNMKLQHCFVESPTAGDNIYRYKITTTSDMESYTIQLPDYFEYLNENTQVWVTPIGKFNDSYVEEQTDKIVKIKCKYAGEFNVMIMGTRKDEIAKKHFHGPEYIAEDNGSINGFPSNDE